MRALQLFLSYNSADRTSVIAVQKLLEARGITTFLDRDNLGPGLLWPQALEEGLRDVRAVAVFIGRELGGWQKREMWFALDRQVREEKQNRAFPVIPVLLQGADMTPAFLFLNTWIDLRGGLNAVVTAEALDAFERAVTAGEISVAQASERDATICPYRGLQIFREEDAAFFVGRSAFSQRLLEFTLGKDMVGVVGPSGSGKSSVVQAGLVPLLRRERPPASTWDAVSFTPGNNPFHGLASALIPLLEQDLSETDRLTEAQNLGERLAGGQTKLEAVINRVIQKSNGTGRLLLVADQFEELFTLTPEVGRRPFAQALLRALGSAPFTLLVTLRADFYGQIIALDRELSDRLVSAQVSVGALTRDELRQSVTAPAILVGLDFEPGLVERILSDVGDEPGHLPLLEFALTELWQYREGNRLTNQAYDEIGGAPGALAQRADAEFARLKPEEQIVARRLFSRMVHVARPEEAGEDTRQRTDLSDADTLAMSVANRLADARLLVTDGDTSKGVASVEIAHEALIRNWERLRAWLNEDREFLLWRRRLREHVSEWNKTTGDKGALLRGAALSEAEDWFTKRLDDVLPAERDYIQASESAATASRHSLWAGATVILVVLLVSTIVALRQRSIAAWQRDVAYARQLAAAAQYARDHPPTQLEISGLLAVESLRRSPLIEGDQAARYVLALLPRRIASLLLKAGVKDVSFSPDGHYFLVASPNFEGDSEVLVCDLRTDQVVFRKTLPVPITRAALNSSTGRIAIATASKPRNGPGFQQDRFSNRVVIYDLASGSQLMVLQHSDSVNDLNFSPDGEHLATASVDHTAVIWELRTGRQLRVFKHPDGLERIVFSPSGKLLATVDWRTTTRVWKVAGGDAIAKIKSSFFALGPSEQLIAFSPDEQTIATVMEEGVLVCDSHNGRIRHVLPHEGNVHSLAFSSDGKYIATGAGGRFALFQVVKTDNSARLWELATGREVIRVADDEVHAVALSANGDYIATGSWGGIARIWSVKHNAEVARVVHVGKVNSVAISPDGRYFAIGCDDGIVRLYRMPPNDASQTMVHTAPSRERLWNPSAAVAEEAVSVKWLAISPDNKYIATADSAGNARIWDLGTGQEIFREGSSGELLLQSNHLNAIAFSGDSKYVAIARSDGTTKVVEARSGQEVAAIKEEGFSTLVRFSPDGKFLATALADETTWLTSDSSETTESDRTVSLWNVGTWRPTVRLKHDDSVLTFAFSPDSKRIASATGVVVYQDGSIRAADATSKVWLWDAISGRNIFQSVPAGSINSLDFSPDGRFFATAGASFAEDKSGMLQVWSGSTGQSLRKIKQEHVINRLVFSPQGTLISTASEDGTVCVFRVASGVEVFRVKHQGEAVSVAFSPDGEYLASAGQDSTARIWEVPEGYEVARVLLPGLPTDVGYTNGGRDLATTSDDGAARVWMWRPEDLIAELCARLDRNLSKEEWRQYLACIIHKSEAPKSFFVRVNNHEMASEFG